MIRQTLAGALLALALLSASAGAQTTVTTNAGSNSTSGANSASNSAGAIGGNQVNAPINTQAGARSRSASSSTSQSGTSNVRSSQRLGVVINNGSGDPSASDPSGDPPAYVGSNDSTQTLRNVPEIVAPNISGGNPCLVGAAGGVAVAGFGMTLGGGWEDRGCERRNSAALLNNIGEKKVAVALMCQDDRVRAAFAQAGEPCPGTVTVGATQTTDAAIIRRQQEAVTPPPVIAAAAVQPARPDWCLTASRQELRSHPQCD